ncbi:MAG: rod shape-determining protein [Halanaerobiaceae bacterium]
MFNFSKKIGIDLGTVNLLVYERKKGIVLEEPSVVARNKSNGDVLAVGREAKKMIGRTPGNIVAIRPLKGGVIADFEVAELMLKHLISQVVKRRHFFKPTVMICVPVGITGVEKRAVIEVAKEVGAKESYLIEEPLAAAIGSGLPVAEPDGSMIVDIGGGTSEIAVISLGGIVLSDSLRMGGDDFDESLIRYIRDKHNIIIGEKTAEEIKIEIGAACMDENKEYEVRGRDVTSGLPKKFTVSSAETVEAFAENVYNIIENVKNVLEQTPPELSSDIMDKGIVLTGGGSLLTGFKELLCEETQVPVFLADEPLYCVARGTGQALEQLDNMENMLLSSDDISY